MRQIITGAGILADEFSQLLDRPLESAVGTNHLIERQFARLIQLESCLAQPLPLERHRLRNGHTDLGDGLGLLAFGFRLRLF